MCYHSRESKIFIIHYYLFLVAKVHIPPGCTWQQVADQLKTIGMTLDRHQLADGTYRAYVRKNNLQKFVENLNN